MTQMQLIQHLSTFDNQFRVVKLRSKLKEEPFSLSELVDLTFYTDEGVALKASRILEYILFKFPENYLEDIGYFIEHAADIKFTSCKRHYAKILVHLTSPDVPKNVRDALKDIPFDPIAELCFTWMDDPKMLTRVRASAAETLFNLRHRYPWIAEGLSRRLEAMIPGASPMMLARANYILSFLHCED
jgi:hypothetical protein